MKKILVVDDHDDTRRYMATIIESWGHDVHTAPGAEAAMELDCDEFSVVLSDIGMPGKDGFQLIREMKGKGCDAFFVAVTGYAMNEDRRKTSKAGFDAHMSKPIDLRALRDLLDQIGRGSGRADRNSG